MLNSGKLTSLISGEEDLVGAAESPFLDVVRRLSFRPLNDSLITTKSDERSLSFK